MQSIGITERHSPTASNPRRRLRPTRYVCERYDRTPRSIDRWVADHATTKFPKPVHINRRKFWFEDELDAYDAAKADER